ncbi:60S acidic ribosomal protein P2-like protein [Euroglyphus maynei]|uniref:Large ribosomal subunit protein P2 n=1 Tax=Euroglyphus maynei TaxID=6958 RepID=A0A1Y3ARV0_EURMA|nr:60S acidic ribosomal protein P2-like protein [Euroglyphus maynei]
MRYVAAYLLAVLGGNKSPSKDDITKILSSVGIEVDDEKLSKVVTELKGKSVDELIEQGMCSEKLASVPSGGGGGGVAAGAPAAGAADTAADTGDAKGKKEEKEEEEEEDDDMGFGLFD